jgi:hypothetical protein
MKKFRLIHVAVAGLIALSSLTACSGGSQFTVSTRPETPYYARPMSPGSGYVWIDGDWVVRGGRYQWREGRWARSRNRTWVGGNWDQRNGGWYWRRGYYR